MCQLLLPKLIVEIKIDIYVLVISYCINNLFFTGGGKKKGTCMAFIYKIRDRIIIIYTYLGPRTYVLCINIKTQIKYLPTPAVVHTLLTILHNFCLRDSWDYKKRMSQLASLTWNIYSKISSTIFHQIIS